MGRQFLYRNILCRRDGCHGSGSLTQRHGRCHVACAAIRLVRCTDRAARYDYALGMLWDHRAHRDIERRRGHVQGYACSVRIVNIHRPAAEGDRIVEPALMQYVLAGQHVLAFDAPRLANTYARRDAGEDGLFKSRHLPLQESSDTLDLLAPDTFGFAVSMEALVRWFDPVQGMIPPNDFIPLAEETGLIVQIGEIVLRKACEAAMLWPPDVRVSVNISAIQFRDLNLAQKIASMLAHTGLPPTRLELEITEATLLSDDSDSLKTLNALRDTGVRIVIDDFGTGYSSLNYIRSFPFDKIKIDKSYVDELAMVSNKSNVILHSVLSMARHLELRTTAEGVETRDQMQQLRDAGCTELQGYYFNKPMAEKDVLAMFASAQEDDLEAGLSAIDRRTAV